MKRIDKFLDWQLKNCRKTSFIVCYLMILMFLVMLGLPWGGMVIVLAFSWGRLTMVADMNDAKERNKTNDVQS